MNRELAINYLRSSGYSEEQIKAIEGAFACDKCVYSTSEGCQYDDITETIPPFDKTGWIPVSERLPELNRPLLVTAYHRVYYGHLISESGNYGYPVFRIHGLGDKNHDWVQETMSHGPYSLGRIDAWMYLDIPEPYKAEGSGE
jgi:hypothetical protein